jgi:Undecaprenyl-phosphate glucose phosphotransferase
MQDFQAWTVVESGPSAAGAVARALPSARTHWFFAGDARTMFFGAMRVADVFMIAVSAVLAKRIRWGSYELGYVHWLQVVVACVIVVNVLGYAGIYTLSGLRHRVRHLGRVGATWAGALLGVVAIIYFTKMAEAYSREWVLLWAATGYVGLVAVRLAAWGAVSALRGNGWLVHNIAVIGEDAAAEELARHIEESAGGYVRVVGVFLPKADARSTTPDVEALVQLTRRIRIDEIAVSLPCAQEANLGGALRKLGTVPVDVNLFPQIADPRLRGLMSARVPFVPLIRRPLAGWEMIVKRVTDIVVSTMALLLFAPLMLVIAALVKLESPGPVLFRQRRFGFNKKPITIYKFRTMCREAALDLSAMQARRGDPRVTRVGRILRSTSLDELPQLFNVLNGSMSLVGPRPHPTALDERYAALIGGYFGRHRVRPGITGWAQVNGLRGETDTIDKMERRLEYDLYYIEHYSLLFDLYILALTVFVAFHHRNAY